MYRKRNFRLCRIHLQEEVYAEKTPVSYSRDKVRSEEEEGKCHRVSLALRFLNCDINSGREEKWGQNGSPLSLGC